MPFSLLFVTAEMRERVSSRAWLDAMLCAEAALARAEARTGLISPEAAAAIERCCRPGSFDPETIAAEARAAGNPAEPLVRALRQAVSGDAADVVHLGATSQDIMDTAAMLVAKEALALIERDLRMLSDLLARLAAEHRQTLMPARTLMQQALPTTFGLKAAGWLAGVTRAQHAMERLHGETLAAELGGAAGTLAALEGWGVPVLRAFATEVGLAEPALPWHTERSRLVEIAAALALAAGAVDKIALDISLLAQTEVGEVAEGGEGGGSSTMPHKQNPTGAVLARACAREASSHIATLMTGMGQELERAAGAWHAEWDALSGALAYTGGAVSWVRAAIRHLDVRPDRMRANLEATGGLIMAERVALVLAEHMGRAAAHDRLRSLSRRAREEGKSLHDVLLADEIVSGLFSREEIEHMVRPEGYLGSASELIDRALALHRVAAP